MGIKVKNQSEFVANASVPGAAAADLNIYQYLVPFPLRLKAIYAKARVAGVTGTGTYDINKNGTTIFASAKLDFATTSQNPTYGALATDPLDFVKGDLISVDCDAVHSGTPLDGLALTFVFQRVKNSGPVGAVVTGGWGADAE